MYLPRQLSLSKPPLKGSVINNSVLFHRIKQLDSIAGFLDFLNLKALIFQR